MLEDKSITEHMEVVDSGGHSVGRVDHVEGDLIKLTRGGPDNVHRYIAIAAVDRIDGDRLILSTDAPAPMSEAEMAAASAYHSGNRPHSDDRPLFGTSGTGTGMGGSGAGEH